jgi:hypothetical protein
MEVLKKVETKTSLTWTWKNMPTLILFQGFFVFVQFSIFKNTLKNLPKWTLKLLFLVHPNVLSP